MYNVQSLFHVPVPTEWDVQTEVVVVQPVCCESKECKDVLSLIHQTLPAAQLIQLDRIQNLWLWEKYNHCRDRMFLKNPESAVEKDLFHGTSVVPPDQVYLSEHGFDFRLSSRKARWGTGTYFTTCAKYSDKYSHKIPGTTRKQLLLAKVLTGQSCVRPQERTLTRPPPKPTTQTSSLLSECYDSVQGMISGSDIYVIYDHEKAYPAYTITYTT